MLHNLEIVPATAAPRLELLRWLNALQPEEGPNGCAITPLTKVEQCGNCVGYCLALTDMLPIPYEPLVTRLKVPARHEFDAVANMKVMQDALRRNGITKPDVLLNDSQKLVSGNFQANLQFLQWFRGLSDALDEAGVLPGQGRVALERGQQAVSIGAGSPSPAEKLERRAGEINGQASASMAAATALIQESQKSLSNSRATSLDRSISASGPVGAAPPARTVVPPLPLSTATGAVPAVQPTTFTASSTATVTAVAIDSVTPQGEETGVVVESSSTTAMVVRKSAPPGVAGRSSGSAPRAKASSGTPRRKATPRRATTGPSQRSPGVSRAPPVNLGGSTNSHSGTRGGGGGKTPLRGRTEATPSGTRGSARPPSPAPQRPAGRTGSSTRINRSLNSTMGSSGRVTSARVTPANKGGRGPSTVSSHQPPAHLLSSSSLGAVNAASAASCSAATSQMSANDAVRGDFQEKLLQTERERQFYYDKLRMIESLVATTAMRELQSSDISTVTLARSIRDVLYATN